MGAVAVLVDVQPSVAGLYFPPVFKSPPPSTEKPPQTIISVPLQIAVCTARLVGALAMLVGTQLSVPGLYLPPVFKVLNDSSYPPRNHFAASPDCRVIHSCRGRIRGAGGSPIIRAGIVSSAGVQREEILIFTAPDDHFAASPDSCVSVSSRRYVSANIRPTVCAGVVSPASIQCLGIYSSSPPHTTISVPVHTAQ